MNEGGELVRGGQLAIRRMHDDLADMSALVRWLNEPHVKEWWDPDEPPVTLDAARKEYGKLTYSSSSTVACILTFADRPVGYLQFYQWSSYESETREVDLRPEPGWYGLDILIGEPDRVGEGIGSRAVDLLCEYLFAQHGATGVALLTDVENIGAQRAYEKAGFQRIRRTLDLDTRGGERVESWIMVRARDQEGPTRGSESRKENGSE
ncbi:GNAT family N-acetyltransferase [soil metagenome]